MKNVEKSSEKPAIIWFRRDLRLEDNPALDAAHKSGAPIIALFILDDTIDFSPGGASQWWLHHALSNLLENCEKKGVRLILRRGAAAKIVPAFCHEVNAATLYWNRRYAKEEIALDTKIKADLLQQDIKVTTFNGSLLREPFEVKTGGGTHYKVFSPFWRTLKSMGPARDLLTAPRKMKPSSNPIKSDDLASWQLLPRTPNWAKSFEPHWQPGEKNAKKALENFLKNPVNTYDDDRNRPDKLGTSRLSPFLAWGQISPLQIWTQTHTAIAAGHVNEGQADKFLSEIAWREFSYHLLYFYPDMPEKPLRDYFEKFPWRRNAKQLKAWQHGQTGFPIVDAGMRELWQTGWMHNRVRMIVASFLIKDLLIHWTEGEDWFWDTLVDADIASNAASWQWVAGCGADASPYFRIFNPMTQGQKFDPNGDYVRRYVPEIAKLPNKYIHHPWEADDTILASAKIKLGKDYPKPIVDHKQARELALESYKAIKG